MNYNIKYKEIPSIEQYLIDCGIDCSPDDYFNPTEKLLDNCEDYLNMQEGYELLKKNIGKKIYILQDSDCDGIFSSALAYKGLVHIGQPQELITVLYHINKAHGLTKEIVAQIENDCALLWIPDASAEDTSICDKKDIDILITDHHQTTPVFSPRCMTINNQHSPIKNKSLCGTGVTYKFLEYYCKKEELDIPEEWITFVSIANIADVMSMTTGENRWFNYYGLSNLHNEFIKILCEKWIKDGIINPTSISWNVTPKFNAVCRGDNQELKARILNCLVSPDIGECLEVANLMTSEHRKQSNLVKNLAFKVLKTATVNDNIVFAVGETGNYSGLVANRIMSLTDKPTLIIHQVGDYWTGSARSPVPLRDLLNESGFFDFNAGHDCSFGTKFAAANIPKIKEYCAALQFPTPEIFYHFTANNIPNWAFGFWDEYINLWGKGLEKPQFYIDKIKINSHDIQELGNATIKFMIGDISFIKFFVSKELKEKLYIRQDKDIEIELVGSCVWNEYNGYRNKQVQIDKIEAHEPKELNWDELWK